jgi:hypothetical protein
MTLLWKVHLCYVALIAPNLFFAARTALDGRFPYLNLAGALFIVSLWSFLNTLRRDSAINRRRSEQA